MLGIFKSKSKLEKLEIKYKKLLEESFKFSSINRRLSDEKAAEADIVLQEIQSLKENK